jgi:uncharacterized membrane protein
LNLPAAAVSLVVAFYDLPGRAYEALERLSKRTELEIGDAAVMIRREGGLLQLCETTGLGGGTGSSEPSETSILTELFPPSVLALSPVGASAEAALDHFLNQGFETNLLKEIGENLPPNGAAVVAVIEEKWLPEVAETFVGYADLERYAMRLDASARFFPKRAEQFNAHAKQ